MQSALIAAPLEQKHISPVTYCTSTKKSHARPLSCVFRPPAAAAEALPVLQISHAQQEHGQLFPAQQRRIPPSLGNHHHTSTPAISSPLHRMPPGLRALRLALPDRQSQPVAVIALALHQSLAACDLQSPAKVSGPAGAAGQDSLFPGARLP